MDRRSFLKMAGCAAVAAAVPSYVATTPKAIAPPLTTTVLRDAVALLDAPIYLQFADWRGDPVGPAFEIPSEWWAPASGGVIHLRHGTIDLAWNDAPAVLERLQLWRDGKLLLWRDDVFGGPQMIGRGDAVRLAISIGI